MRRLTASDFFLALIAAAALVPSHVGIALAQQVHVFDDPPPHDGSTPTDAVLKDGKNQSMLVIPVVTQDTIFDPENNLLDSWTAGLKADLEGRFAQVSQFWEENSYGRVSFSSKVLDRYYQMPRGVDFYFHPAYVEPHILGSPSLTAPVDVPSGTVQLELHVSDADESLVQLEFDAADSPYTFAELETAIRDQLEDAVGDKLEVDLVGFTGRRLSIAVGTRHVRAGTYVLVDVAQSDAEVLDALGIDRPEVDLTPVRVTSVGEAFPVATTAGDTLTLTVENQAGATDVFPWTFAGGAIASAADFAAVHNATHPEVTISATPDGRIRFDVAPTIAGPIELVSFTASSPALLDALGLDDVEETLGVVTFAARNTVKGDRRMILGQAVAAYMLNELTRPEAGPDAIPNTPITAANEATLDGLFQANIDGHRAIVVVFLDATGKRAGATGGYIDAGIENAGFLYHHQTYASGQIAFQTSPAETLAHEVGHNIGFHDLYDNGGGNYDPSLRYPVNWDAMHRQDRFPHTGAWHKERVAGWLGLTGAQIDDFPLPAMPGTETRRYVITPLEYGKSQYDDLLAGVPAGAEVAKAVRLPLGLGATQFDHYIELENRQAGEVFSQQLPQVAASPAPGGVYVTDAIDTKVYNYFEITGRNYVHPLTDRPLLSSGDTSPVLDQAPAADISLLSSYPAYAGISIDIVDELSGPPGLAAAKSYVVDVAREQSDFIDLRITPWGAPPWETVDIWVEHADGTLSSTPLAGNGEAARWSPDYDPAANGGQPLNWMRVMVHNDGTVQADDVVVKLKINTPGGMGDSGTWVELPVSSPQDIPAGDSRIFDFPWSPKVNSHTCAKAEIKVFGGPLGDIEPFNNGTQENVTSFAVASSSPWHPQPIEFTVANGLPRDIDVELEPAGLPRGFLLDLEPRFMTVPAETTVLVAGKVMIDDAVIPPPVPDGEGGLKPRPRPRTWHINANVLAGDYRVPIGGITYVVLPTLEVDIDFEAYAEGKRIFVRGGTEPPVGGETFEVEVRYPSGRHVWVETTSHPNGTFTAALPAEETGKVRIEVHYPSGGSFAPTSSGAEYVEIN